MKNQYQLPLNCENHKHVESISDIEFNPDQKMTNEFLKSQSLIHGSNSNSKSRDKSNDVNRAFIDNEAANDDTESNVNSFCGELANQLNNTSAFGPDNLTNEFKGEEKVSGKFTLGKFGENTGIQQSKKKESKIKTENVFGRTVDIQNSIDQEVDELFKNALVSQKDSDSLSRDIQNDKVLGGLEEQQKGKTRNKGETDVNLEDLMKVSMATDFNPPAPSDAQNLKMEQKNSVNISNDDDLSSFDIQHTDVKEKKRGNN